MGSPASWVVVGLYNGGTSNNATVLDHILAQTGTARTSVRAVGLDTPGPASADGIISSKGATNFSQPAWHGFDVRGALKPA